jgi:hypothetical protein
MRESIAAALEKLDPFDHAFVDAVLRIQGIDELPTSEQFRAARAVLDAYYSALMRAPASTSPLDEEWLEGHTLESAASQFAFLFTQYSVLYLSQASDAQIAAFTQWWQTGEPPMPPALHVRSRAAAGH